MFVGVHIFEDFSCAELEMKLHTYFLVTKKLIIIVTWRALFHMATGYKCMYKFCIL